MPKRKVNEGGKIGNWRTKEKDGHLFRQKAPHLNGEKKNEQKTSRKKKETKDK